MTCADAELVLRGRGPPPVPRRMSLVAALCAAAVLGRASTLAIAAVRARNARRERVCIPRVCRNRNGLTTFQNRSGERSTGRHYPDAPRAPRFTRNTRKTAADYRRRTAICDDSELIGEK